MSPDPNLKWASELVRRASLNEDGSPGDSLGEELALGVAFDGDGDRNMIVGHRFFASPSDSLAVLAAQAKSIKWFADRGGLAACARSMPTSTCSGSRRRKTVHRVLRNADRLEVLR